MARRLFYAGKITPRWPDSVLIYGGKDPFGDPPVHPLFQPILDGFQRWTGGCGCEAPSEDNNWTGAICEYHQTHDPRGD